MAKKKVTRKKKSFHRKPIKKVVKKKSNNPLDVQVGGGHYKDMKIQPVEFCQANQLNACESAIVKYASRHKNKNGAEDVKKIIHYGRLLLKLEYPNVKED